MRLIFKNLLLRYSLAKLSKNKTEMTNLEKPIRNYNEGISINSFASEISTGN